MTPDGVARIERGLEIILPDDLRQLYLEDVLVALLPVWVAWNSL